MEIQFLDKKRAKLIVTTGSGKSRRRRTKTVTYQRKRDCTKLWNDFAREVEKYSGSDVTVAGLVRSYIENCSILGVRPTTVSGYKTCEKRIISAIGEEKAKDLTTYQVDDFIVTMAKKYKSKTIHNTISLLNAAYQRAIKTGLLQNNPCDNSSKPILEEAEKEVFTDEEVTGFLRAINNERLDFKVAYELAILCGLRRSEILGLTPDDISLAFKTVNIHETRHVVYENDDHKGHRSLQEAKTKRSRRTLAIPDLIVEDVKALIDLHNSYEFDIESDRLILTAFGKEMHPATLTNHLTVIEKNNGLPHVSLHELRHTFASMLNANKIDIARISAELGHSNIATTVNTYMHVFNGETASSRGISEAMNDIVEKTATFSATREKEKTVKAL